MKSMTFLLTNVSCSSTVPITPETYLTYLAQDNTTDRPRLVASSYLLHFFTFYALERSRGFSPFTSRCQKSELNMSRMCQVRKAAKIGKSSIDVLVMVCTGPPTINFTWGRLSDTKVQGSHHLCYFDIPLQAQVLREMARRQSSRGRTKETNDIFVKEYSTGIQSIL